MSKSVVNEFQPSVTEWFALIGEKKAAEDFRIEDNKKVERLEFLFQTIGLPYERPDKLDAIELSQPSARFQKILKKRGDELCAIRLVPKKEGLPKIRNRGLSIKSCYQDWYLQQKIDPNNYIAFICPHVPDIQWSMIFVISDEMIFGETIRGGHAQLTQGDTTNKLLNFQYNFQQWSWTETDPEAKKIVIQALNYLKVTKPISKKSISDELKVEFHHNYIGGYFEAVVWPNGRVYFIDFNRILPNYIPAPPPLVKVTNSILTGKVAFPGKVIGRVVIVDEDNISRVDFHKGDILVCPNTDVRFLPLMRKASGIITDRGGLLSHAAIIARELKIACLVDTKNATTTLKTGDKIVLDCDNNIISCFK